MEFSCDRKSLLAAARRTAKAAASTTTVDALAGILLTADAENYELTLSATDLNIAITCTVTAPVVAGGSVVVGAKLFVEMLSLLKGQTVEIKLHPQHQLAVTSDTAGYLVACLPAEEFPSLNLPEQTETIELSGVKGLAKQTVFAAAKSGNLPMQCVKLKPAKKGQADDRCESVGEEEKLLFSTDGKQAVFYSPEQDMTFATRLGSGTYLDADTVLSGVAKQYEALVDASEFRSALDRTITLSGTGSAYINLVFSLGMISLTCETEHGTAKDSLPAQVITVMPPEGFCYQGRKLLQGIQTMNGPIRIIVSAEGLLLISGGEQSFFQSPGKKPVAKTAKKKMTKKSATKAA